MRRTRLRTRKSNKNYNYTLLIFFLIIIPAIAIFIGSRITEKIVVPVLYSDLPLEEGGLEDIINRDDEYYELGNDEEDKDELEGEENSEDNNDEVEEMVHSNLSPLSVYMIQVASVSATGSMEGFVEELNKKELPHLIYKMEDTYKIYTLGLTNRIFVETQLPKMREHYPDAYISEIHLAAKKISYPKDQEDTSGNIIKSLNSLIEIMDKQAEEWYNFIDKESELNSYKELLTKQQNILEELLQNIDANSLPEALPKREELERMVLHQQSNSKRALELLEENENVYRVHSLFLDSLFRTLETIK